MGNRRIYLAATIVATASAIALLWLYLRHASLLVVEVPSGFSGPFIVIEDPDAPAIRRAWGRVELTVDASRVIRVRSIEPLLNEWQSIIAVSPVRTYQFVDDATGRAKPQLAALRGFRFLREQVGSAQVSSFELAIGTTQDDIHADYHKLRQRAVVP